ncbi:hypothetical protein FORC88_1426 [Salmonella enterica subsp. enterica serovar Typhimurium]|nr:hypothetical protein FORC88_1426 [Salmonella enterica subsp. enterica serovar Typhimurium]CAK4059184.1 hypothetical protein [Salmonella enterica subsp. enterica serovar Rissen]
MKLTMLNIGVSLITSPYLPELNICQPELTRCIRAREESGV